MLEGLSLGHILVVGAVVLVLFGRGKVSSLMGEVGKGISAFKRGLKEPEAAEAAALPTTAEAEAKAG